LWPSPSRAQTPTHTSDPGLRELIAVREIAHAFLAAERPADVFEFALDRVSPLVGASLACLYLLDGDSDMMRLAAAYNWPKRYASFLGQMRVRMGAGPSGQAASERRTIEVLDVFADLSLADWQPVARELGFRSLVALPLEAGGTALGAVAFYFASPNAVGAETHHLMRTVADQMAATAEKAAFIEGLRRANAALTASNATLERQNADLIEARRVKDEFLANISHELRTPLTAVIGYISLMQEGLAGPVSAEQQETLEQVKGASEELLVLIGDLLELTALKRGFLVSELTEIDPREPLRDALSAIKRGRRRPEVMLEVGEPEHVPTMRTDRRAVTKALGALVDNALKFTRVGHVRVAVRVAGDRVLYSVEDTGVGIPNESQRAVFEEFRQVDGSATREFGGSGLGLALARRLARSLNGDISLTSRAGVGSTFTLTVPLRCETSEDP
jgi:signal transduction histidine kinase